MQKFILGYTAENDMQNLTEFNSKAEADYGAEEWCEVEAESLEDAKQKYESEFDNWQKSERGLK